MTGRQWEVGICGTFDVANYGDLLFPLIAESELTERLGAVRLHRFSYHAKVPPAWPYEVTSVTELPQRIDRLDGLLIGGGFLIRFDKEVASGYLPPTPDIHHPTGYWLTPALIALQHDVPVFWNAPGMHCNDLPAWAHPLIETVLTLSRYVSVRDEPTRAALETLTSAGVAVVPDTAFRLPRLLDLAGGPSAEFTRVCEASGLDGPYIVLQATLGLEGFVRLIKKHREEFQDFRFLALPVSPVLGERAEIIDADLPGCVCLAEWPSPLLMAELIGRAQAVVGHSYHLFITAIASGVPVFTEQNLSAGKYSALRHFDTIFEVPRGGEPDPGWFLARVGRRTPSVAARATYEPLGEHWDRIAAGLRTRTEATAPAMNRLWQSLPRLLEATQTCERIETQLRERLGDAQKQLTAARADAATQDRRIAEIMASTSWRITAPLRFVGRQLRPPADGRIVNLEHIRHHRLETDPYEWAVIKDLFKPDDAEGLAATYPCDHFKLVAAHGGEKDYEYYARALLRMGAGTIAYPDDLSGPWRALAADLLSPDYRAAMTALTGCDLTQAPMEVNVFHYGPGGALGAHRDLPEKLVTHVLYFNRSWNRTNGGCLSILRSSDPTDIVAEIPPIVGCSCVIVRSEGSWHAVSRVVDDSASSRRSVTVTFYRPGSVSSMWPPDDTAPLHRYQAADLT